MGDKHEKKKKMSTAKKLGITLFGEIVFFALLIIGYGFYYANSKLNQLNYDDIDYGAIGIEKPEELKDAGYTNIALFGLDSRDVSSETGNRSDSIMVASINNETKEVRIISIYRDTYVEMVHPNGGKYDGRKTKITHVYAYGGPTASIATINKNYDLQITDYVTVNFKSLSDVIDDLGGVTVNVTYDEMNSVNQYIWETAEVAGTGYTPISQTGDITLDGIQATTYCRIRNIGAGDIDRAARQREVIQAILDKAKKSDLATLNRILDDVLPEISTSLSKKELVALMADVLKYEIGNNEGFPFVDHLGSYYDEIAGQNLSIGVAGNVENNAILLHNFFYDTTTPGYESLLYGDSDDTADSQDVLDASEDDTVSVSTEASTADPDQKIYEPSEEVIRISNEIQNATGVYPPADLSVRGQY